MKRMLTMKRMMMMTTDMDPITPQGIFAASNAPILSASDAEVKEIKVLHSLQYVVSISSDTYAA